MARIAMSRYEPIDAGTYRAKVGSATIESGQFGEQLKLRFDLLEEGYEEKSLMYWASWKLSPKSKLYGAVSALLFGGRPVPDDFECEESDLLDRECMILVDVEEKATGTFNKVAQLIPLRRNGKSPLPAGTTAGKAAPAATTPGRAAVNTARPDEPPDWMSEPPSEDDLPF